MSGLLQTYLWFIGISKKQPSFKVGSIESVNICEDDDEKCIKRLLRTDRDMGEGVKRFLKLHLDLINKSKMDVYNSRAQMLVGLFRMFPLWFQFVLFAVLIIGLIVFAIPGIVIFVELLKNPNTLVKVVFIFGILILAFVGYAMVPL